MLSRGDYLEGVHGIMGGLLALRQPREPIWWPFQLTADSAGNIGAGVSVLNPGNGTIYQVPEGMTATLHLLSYTVAGATPGNPVTGAAEWTEVVVDTLGNAPGIWFTPTGPAGWVAPTLQRWGTNGPVFHESQRVTLCGQLAASAIIVGRIMFTLANKPRQMTTRLAASRNAVPAPRPPGTGIPGGLVGNAVNASGNVTAGRRIPGAAG